MKALVKTSAGVTIDDLPIPAPVPGTVVIAVALSGICRTDIYVADNIITTATPLVLGHEFAGTIHSLGPDVSGLHTGQRVAVMPLFATSNPPADTPFDYAEATMLGLHQDGSFAEYVRVPAHAVYPIPDQMTWPQAAYLEPVAASLAVTQAQITPDQRGLIYGDNRISRLTARCLQACGFAQVDICDGTTALPANSYDFIIETLADSDAMQRMVTALKPGGRLILKSRQHTPVSFNINQLVLKSITLEAVNYAPFTQAIDLIASGALVIDDLFGPVYPLDDYACAFAADRQGENKKIFLTAHSDVRDI